MELYKIAGLCQMFYILINQTSMMLMLNNLCFRGIGKLTNKEMNIKQLCTMYLEDDTMRKSDQGKALLRQ